MAFDHKIDLLTNLINIRICQIATIITIALGLNGKTLAKTTLKNKWQIW